MTEFDYVGSRNVAYMNLPLGDSNFTTTPESDSAYYTALALNTEGSEHVGSLYEKKALPQLVEGAENPENAEDLYKLVLEAGDKICDL